MNQGKIFVASQGGLYCLDGNDCRSLLPDEAVLNVFADDDIIACALGANGTAISDDGGQSWHRSGSLSRKVMQLCWSQGEPGKVYAGTQPATLLSSDDLGQSWQTVQDLQELPGAEFWEIPIRDQAKPVTSEKEGFGAACLNVLSDPHRPDRLIVGVEVGGLIISDDGGHSWNVKLVDDNPDVHTICLHPTNPDVSLISTGFSRFTDKPGVFSYAHTGGVYGSNDRMQSFHRLWPEDPEPQYTRAMCWDDRAPYPVTICARSSYVQPSNPTGERRAVVKQSFDCGITWSNLGTGAFQSFDEEFSGIAPDPTAPGGVVVGTEKGRLFRIPRGGGEWIELTALSAPINAIASVL